MWQNRDNSTAGGYLNTTMDTSENKTAPVRRVQNVMPLVIRQIKNCQGEEFKLFGMTAQIIKLVGIIRSFEVQTTKANYTIEDNTGEVKAILWLETDGDTTTNLPSVKEGSYVQVYGSLRLQDGERMLMILRMFPVVDSNIITTHLLSVVYARLTAEADSKKMVSDIQLNNPGAALANSIVAFETSASVATGLTPLQEKVLQTLAKDNSANGMSIETLMTNFSPNQHHQVNEALSFLSNEGHIYSTTDNDHYRVTSIN